VTVQAPAATPVTAPPRRIGRLRRFLLLASSPWTSLSLLLVVFIHQALGSAGYLVRQHFEVNEMEWFNGWLSLLLWSAICVCLSLASIFRIPWSLSRAGAHLTHLGVISVVVTSAIYFSNKFEGEALLLRHYIDITTSSGSCRLLPNPGYTQSMGDAVAKVEAVMPHWSVLSGSGVPQQAWAVMVTLQFPDGKPFTSTLIEDRPELTQYTLQGRQPTSWLSDYPALEARDGRLIVHDAAGGSLLSTELRVKARTVEKTGKGERSLEITNITPDFPLMSPGFEGRKGTMVEWTLKTPAGQESGSAIVSEPSLTRFQRARVKQVPDPRLQTIALAPAPCALAYHQSLAALYVRTFSGEANSPSQPIRSLAHDQVAHTALPGLPRYHDHGRHIEGGQALALEAGTFGGVHFTVTGFAPYADLISRWVEDAGAPLHPVLDLTFLGGGSSQPLDKVLSLSEDAAALDDTPLLWLRSSTPAELQALTARLAARFPVLAQETTVEEDAESAAKTRIVFISAPDGAITLWIGQPGRNLAHYPIAPGGQIDVRMWNEELTVRLKARLEHPRKLTAPRSVPEEERESRSSVGSFRSFIEVTARLADSRSDAAAPSWSVWLPYTPFPHLPTAMGDADSTLGAYAPHPVHLEVPGAGDFELEYSRELLPLDGPLTMTGFDVPRRPGSDEPAEYFCTVSYGQPSAPEQAIIHMNYPLNWNDTFFFQENWDPAYQALTVLGVGNRPGGNWMLAAAILLAVGMAWSGVTAARRGAPAVRGGAAP